MIKPSICLAGFITCIAISAIFYYTVYLTEIPTSLEELAPACWYFLGGGVAAGIIAGCVLACFSKVGAAILAGWGGFMLGVILVEVAFAWSN